METKKMGEIYQQIAEQLNGMIPDEWSKIYFYGEVLEDSREVYFYFNSLTRDEIVYGHDIPEMYNVSEDIYVQLLRELWTMLQDLYDEFKKQNDKVWTNLTLILENDGKFNIKFNYDDVLNSPFSDVDRQIIWEYEVMNVQPTTDEHKKIIEEYLNSKQST